MATNVRFASLFSGGGVLECGLSPMITPVLAVEYDAQIAGYYRRNHGDHMLIADVCSVDFAALGIGVDHLHASPVCTRASVANTNRGEAALDIATAQATIRALEAFLPSAFTLENVYPYRSFEAFKMICSALTRLGYWWNYTHANSADYGVSQTRQRLWLWARRDTMLSALPTPTAWQGWYDAIADLIPALPDTQFAPWQLARLPNELQETIQIANGGYANTIVTTPSDQPSNTVTSNQNQTSLRAFVVDGTANNHYTSVTTRNENEQLFTVTASVDKHTRRAYANGRVVQLSPRCLARFQAMPDTYELPTNRALACKIIGNGAPFGALINHMWNP